MSFQQLLKTTKKDFYKILIYDGYDSVLIRLKTFVEFVFLQSFPKLYKDINNG